LITNQSSLKRRKWLKLSSPNLPKINKSIKSGLAFIGNVIGRLSYLLTTLANSNWLMILDLWFHEFLKFGFGLCLLCYFICVKCTLLFCFLFFSRLKFFQNTFEYIRNPEQNLSYEFCTKNAFLKWIYC
jgi:hypothetical protein